MMRFTQLGIVRSKPQLGAVVAAFVLNGILWVVVVARAFPQAGTVNLHYNIYFGIDLLGPWWHWFFLPVAGSIIVVVNTFLAVVLFKRERLASIFLVGASVLAQIFLLMVAFFTLTQL